jgi:multisubunit Na+/H+ antiporter MnhE subunit
MTFVIGVIYLALTANLEPANLVAALLIGIAVSMLVRPQQLTIAWRRLPLALWSILRYLGILILDLVKSGIQVGGIILNPRLPIDPGIVVIDAGCQSELGTALSAHAMTLTPGELVVEMDDQGLLFVHCLDASKSAQYVAEAQDLRQDLLSKIFE